MHDVLDFRDLLADELVQRRVSGYHVSSLETEVDMALRDASGPRDPALARLLDRLDGTRRRGDWPYHEPSSLDDVLATLPEPTNPDPTGVPVDDELRDRLLGAWLGRCAGCTVGKPVEGWTHPEVRSYLVRADAYPLFGYLPLLDPWPEGLPPFKSSWTRATHGRVCGVPRDDDVDYTLLGLHVLEEHGLSFTVADLASELLDHLPFTQVYTSERAAYRNLVSGLVSPETATYRNPYREWIGGLIRADIFGYVAPGDARRAAELAHRDASLSHTENGIYGAMWAAALIASCFAAKGSRSAVTSAISYIPPGSRLAEALGMVLELHGSGMAWSDARDEIQARYGHLSWVHVINNAAVIAASLLWGEGDFMGTIGFAVEAGGDTDSNCATAGSAFGAMHGSSALPSHLVDPLENRVRSAISAFDEAPISELAERTYRLACAARAETVV